MYETDVRLEIVAQAGGGGGRIWEDESEYHLQLVYINTAANDR